MIIKKTLILLMVLSPFFQNGFAQKQPEKKQNGGNFSEEIAKNLIPFASSISAELMDSISMSHTSPDFKGFKEYPLSLVLANLSVTNEGFHEHIRTVETTPQDPSKLSSGWYRIGFFPYYTLIPKTFITNCPFKMEGDSIAKGTFYFTFSMGKEGNVDYVATKTKGVWRITEFHLPACYISIKLMKDETWQFLKQPVTEKEVPEPILQHAQKKYPEGFIKRCLKIRKRNDFFYQIDLEVKVELPFNDKKEVAVKFFPKSIKQAEEKGKLKGKIEELRQNIQRVVQIRFKQSYQKFEKKLNNLYSEEDLNFLFEKALTAQKLSGFEIELNKLLQQ